MRIDNNLPRVNRSIKPVDPVVAAEKCSEQSESKKCKTCSDSGAVVSSENECFQCYECDGEEARQEIVERLDQCLDMMIEVGYTYEAKYVQATKMAVEKDIEELLKRRIDERV